MRRPICFVLACITCTSFAFAADAKSPARKVQVVQAEVRTQPGSAWAGGETGPDVQKPQPPQPEKLTRYPTPAGEPQTFSGKVVGLPPNAVAQVGVVAMIGVQWIATDNYKWQKLAADGSFTITGDHKPKAAKALVVDVKGRAQTFLRAEFVPTESARDIELRLPSVRPVVITMEDDAGKDVSGFRGEIFTGYQRTDDAGKVLEMQRLGNPTAIGGAIVFDAPADEPIAVLLAGPRVAPYYAIIDPRQADEFHFKMLAESRIRGVVTRDGKPAGGERVFLSNDAAPLSASIRRTDGAGRFDAPGRTPGVHHIRIGTHESLVQVQPGETAQVAIELGTSTPAERPIAPFVPVAAPARTPPAGAAAAR
jgi:hypothetical protein